MRAILTYHSVDPSGSPVSVDRAALERHARFLSRGAPRAVPLAALAALDPDADAVALTFDDAFENFPREAWPVLREHGLPVTVFVVTGRVGASNAWGGRAEPGIPELPLADWEALGRLAEEGVELGVHSRSHPHLPELDAERLRDEVLGAADELAARLGVRPRAFAYPYGEHDRAAVELVRGRFDHACTTELRALGPAEDAHLLPRLDAFYLREPGRLESWGTPRFARYLARRAWLRRLRAALRAPRRARGPRSSGKSTPASG